MRKKQRLRAVLVALLAVLVAGCVGSETASQQRDEDRYRAPGVDESPAWTAGRDTVSPTAYRVFDSVTVSETPRKLAYRLLVMSSASPEVLMKTVRVALDSIAQADTSLAAARAILYTMRPVSERQAELTPSVWGEWVPSEGWDAAGSRSPRRTYRSFIYHGRPGWSRPVTADSTAGDR